MLENLYIQFIHIYVQSGHWQSMPNSFYRFKSNYLSISAKNALYYTCLWVQWNYKHQLMWIQMSQWIAYFDYKIMLLLQFKANNLFVWLIIRLPIYSNQLLGGTEQPHYLLKRPNHLFDATSNIMNRPKDVVCIALTSENGWRLPVCICTFILACYNMHLTIFFSLHRQWDS